MAALTEHGYLVLADISGYTSYLAKVELEHAQEILTDLLSSIVDQFKSMLTISKLEGDAVFANINESQLPRPEALLELIDNTYVGFCQRRDSSQRRTTCTCRACQAMPGLELKFFIHHGDYIVQNISGIRELVGSDVNLIHRLTKNPVSDDTGWRAYLLITQKALAGLSLQLDDLHEQAVAYEHLGEVDTFSLDMRARYKELIETKRLIIPEEEADMSLSCELNAPVSFTWQFLTDPKMLTLTMREGGHWTAIKRPKGRYGVGAQNHCAHGGGVMAYTYLDWQPFHYFTAEGAEGSMKHLEMFLVEPGEDENHTRFTVRLKLLVPYPHWVRKLMVAMMVKQQYLEFFDRCKTLLKEIAAQPA